jgi:LacI family transcriptional regulator
MQTRVTLADVAKKAGVNVSTVSRSLNRETESQVSKSTVKKIRKIAEEMQYTPNTVARGLRTRKSMTIGVIIPDLTNPIFPPIVRGIDSVLFSRGYSALVVNTDNNAEIEDALFDSLMERQVDGLIIATGHTERGMIAKYHNQGVKAVMVNREASGVPYPSVIGEDAAGITAALEHLANLGHKKILHLAGPTALSTSSVRSVAFSETAKRLKLDTKIIKASALSVAAGEFAMNKFLDASPKSVTAVLAGNDLLALGVFHVLRKHGLKAPQDMSVIGFNNMAFSEDFSPSLTTINAPHFEMGAESARLLINQIEGKGNTPRKVMLPVTLVVRESSGPVPKK